MDVLARFWPRRAFTAVMALTPLAGCLSPSPEKKPFDEPAPLPFPPKEKEDAEPETPDKVIEPEDIAKECSIGTYGKDEGVALVFYANDGRRLLFAIETRKRAEDLIGAITRAADKVWPEQKV